MSFANIPKYEGLYTISNNGNVYRNGKELKQRKDKHGYWNVCLCRDNIKKSHRVHVLVLKSFIGERPHKYQGAHLDGNKDNNTLINLEWVTASVNNGVHKQIHGTLNIGSKNGNSKEKRKLRLTKK